MVESFQHLDLAHELRNFVLGMALERDPFDCDRMSIDRVEGLVNRPKLSSPEEVANALKRKK